MRTSFSPVDLASRLLTGSLAAAMLAATPASAQTAGEETVHVVHDGETLNGIANRAGVTAKHIVAANALAAPYVVRIGQKLTIPREKTPREKAGLEKAPREKTAEREKTAQPKTQTPAPEQADLAARGAARTAARVIAERVPPAKVSALPAPATTLDSETSHLVVPGETLGAIALHAKVPRVLIAEANGLRPPYAVRVGQTLQIPRTRRHVVKAGDSGFTIAMRYAVSWDQIALANSLDPAAPVKPGQSLLIPTLVSRPAGAAPIAPAATLPPPVKAVPAVVRAAPADRDEPRFAWPLAGAIKRGYAAGADRHDGLDIAAPEGTMVRASAPGTVKFAGFEKDEFGNLVVLDHGQGWFTVYGFLSRVTVKDGAHVAAGERIGLVGDTGKARGDELHFEVRRDGKPIDPLDQLPKKP